MSSLIHNFFQAKLLLSLRVFSVSFFGNCIVTIIILMHWSSVAVYTYTYRNPPECYYPDGPQLKYRYADLPHVD